jgi:hypothetical protein
MEETRFSVSSEFLEDLEIASTKSTNVALP